MTEIALSPWAAVPAAVLLILGGLLTVIGSLGLLRLKTFYARMHAPTMGATLGTGCVLVASMLVSSAEHFDFPEIELPVEPVQRPYPPLWAAGNAEAAARNGLNVVSGMPLTAEMRRRVDALWAESRRAPQPLNPHVAAPWVGSSQYVCIAPTDGDERRIGERALDVLGRHLARSIGRDPPHLQDPDRPDPPTPLVKAVQSRAPGVLLCGTAATVRDHYLRYAAEGTVNYIVVNVPFGDMTYAEAEYTLDAFIGEVMPAVREAVSG